MTTVQTQMTSDRLALNALRDLRLGATASQAGEALEVVPHVVGEISKSGAAASMRSIGIRR